MPDSYNLLTEPWIPVLRVSGRANRVGLQTALVEAHQIRQIAAPNPMDNVALLRFLLAVLYWCRGNPQGQEEKERILADNRLPMEWLSKLEERRDCFDLLSDEKRFYQNAGYRQHTPTHTTNYLIHEVPSGTNKWHFRHATDLVDGLCPACCALGLIRLPAFSTSGGKGMSTATGKSPGINAKPPIYVIPVGQSLLATLLHSWQPAELLGTPEWEMPCNILPHSGQVPLLTGLTWLPRSVWLADPEEPEAICVSCGRKDRLIRRCVFDGKGSSKAGDRVWRDPHVIYETTEDRKASSLQTINALGATDAAAGHWPGQLAAILQGHHSSGEGLLSVVGFSTVRNDKYLEATEYVLSRPVPPEQQHDLKAILDRWRKEGANLVRRIRPKSSSRKHVEIRPLIDAIRSDVEARVSEETRELPTVDKSAWQQLAGEYGVLVNAVAKCLSPGFTTRAVKRRIEIAQTVPNVAPKLTTKPPKRKGKRGSNE